MYPGLTDIGFRLNVFEKNISGDWEQDFEFAPRKFNPKSIAFDENNTMYAVNSVKSEILAVSFHEDGSPDKIVHIPFPNSRSPLQVVATDGGKVYVSAYGRIDEFNAPLTKRSKAIRTIKITPASIYAVFSADTSGNLYVKNGSVQSGGLAVFTADQSGRATPVRTFTIDPSYTTDLVSCVSLTNDGDLAVVYQDSGIAIFPANVSGADQVPATWYPSDGGYRWVAFDPNGVMAVADYGTSNSIRWFFETP